MTISYANIHTTRLLLLLCTPLTLHAANNPDPQPQPTAITPSQDTQQAQTTPSQDHPTTQHKSNKPTPQDHDNKPHPFSFTHLKETFQGYPRWLQASIVCLFLFAIKRKLEDSLIFLGIFNTHTPPQNQLVTFQDRHGRNLTYLSGAKNKTIDTANEQIYLFFTGNAWTIDDNTMFQVSSYFPGNKIRIFIYPGFGPSKRGPSIFRDDQNFYDALDDLMQHLIQQGYKTQNITLMSHSLGGAAVFYLGAKYTCKKAITMAAFTSIRDAVPSIVAPLMRYHLNNLAYAAQLQCPWFGIHGTEDEVVPYRHGPALYQALPNDIKAKSKFQGLPGVRHGHLGNMLQQAYRFDRLPIT